MKLFKLFNYLCILFLIFGINQVKPTYIFILEKIKLILTSVIFPQLLDINIYNLLSYFGSKIYFILSLIPDFEMGLLIAILMYDFFIFFFRRFLNIDFRLTRFFYLDRDDDDNDDDDGNDKDNGNDDGNDDDDRPQQHNYKPYVVHYNYKRKDLVSGDDDIPILDLDLDLDWEKERKALGIGKTDLEEDELDKKIEASRKKADALEKQISGLQSYKENYKENKERYQANYKRHIHMEIKEHYYKKLNIIKNSNDFEANYNESFQKLSNQSEQEKEREKEGDIADFKNMLKVRDLDTAKKNADIYSNIEAIQWEYLRTLEKEHRISSYNPKCPNELKEAIKAYNDSVEEHQDLRKVVKRLAEEKKKS